MTGLSGKNLHFGNSFLHSRGEDEDAFAKLGSSVKKRRTVERCGPAEQAKATGRCGWDRTPEVIPSWAEVPFFPLESTLIQRHLCGNQGLGLKHRFIFLRRIHVGLGYMFLN